MSHSVWSAWIEIKDKTKDLGREEKVALRLECVDRNGLSVCEE